jgi:2'-5' RNA ligase
MNARLFAAIPIPDGVAEQLMGQQYGVPAAAWRPRENLHLTLRFFGVVEPRLIDDLDRELAAVKAAPFKLKLRGAGWFGRDEPRAIWVGADAEPGLLSLQKKCAAIARLLSLHAEKRKFLPHVTLAYLRGTSRQDAMTFEHRNAGFESDEFEVRQFKLCSSWTSRGDANKYVDEALYLLE